MEKINQYIQKSGINKEYFSLRFLGAGIVLSAAFFLLFITLSKSYTSSMIVFVNAKSEVAAQQKIQIINNVSEFPKTLALYDRLLKYNSDVKDLASGKSPLERKKYWDNLVSVRKVGKDSYLIKISITATQKNDAEELVKKTTETLFYFSSVYYDIKNDVDLRIIENPITRVSIIGWYWIIPSSLILGFLIAFLFQYVFLKRKDFLIEQYDISKEKPLFGLGLLSDKETEKASEQEEIKSLENLYMSDIPVEMPVEPKKSLCDAIASGIQEMKKITKTFEKNKYPNFLEIPKQAKASAPDNLPIADDSFLEQASLNVEQPKKPENAEGSMNKIHPEPDQEKLKKRLNELLKGGF